MTFFSRQGVGRLYVLKLVLPDGTVVHKIGITNSDRTTDRMLEILRSWFNHYRYVPYTEIRLDMEFGYAKRLEKFIHKVLLRYRYSPTYKVEGYTEMFTGVDEFRLLHYLKGCSEANFAKPLFLSDQAYDALGRLICAEK